MPKIFSSLLVSLAVLCGGSSALAPSNLPLRQASSSLTTAKPAFDVKRVAFNGLAAASLASALVVGPMADAIDMFTVTPPPSFFGSSSLIAERVTREGLYKEYDIDLGDQVYDDARSTYKSAKETKTKKGKYTALIAVLVVGSFIIPMAQYFWYVRDDDSSDKFFNMKGAPPPAPVPPPKKKGLFGK